MANRPISSIDAELILETAGALTGIPGGGQLGKLIARTGRTVLGGFITRPSNKKKDAFSLDESDTPPFLVVGMGRCGCHVAAELAAISCEHRNASKTGVRQKSKRFFQKLNVLRIRRKGQDITFGFNPLFFLGDYDGASFDEINGLMERSGVPSEIIQGVIRLSFDPVATGGVGNVPVLADFLTKALIAAPATKTHEHESLPAWNRARAFLTNDFYEQAPSSRLVFYIFSAAGGTGSGSAAELMRIQRAATLTAQPGANDLYYTAVAVLPSDFSINRRRLLNAGRSVLQYLADLNTKIESAEDYDRAPVFAGSTGIETSSGPNDSVETQPVLTFDSLAFISNEVIGRSLGAGRLMEDAETDANQYIAQQLFNLSAAQHPAADFEKDSPGKTVRKNYQSIRLDPQDLKTGLAGPYSVCFALSEGKNLADNTSAWVDGLFIRAISLPEQNYSAGREQGTLVEGVSIYPARKADYLEILRNLRHFVGLERKDESGLKGVFRSEKAEHLSIETLAPLRGLDFFAKAPRVIFVLTQPQDGLLTKEATERLGEVLGWAFPNAQQIRGAVIRGTTALFTLSLYIEGSVVLVPRIQQCIRNYLRFTWNKRRMPVKEFDEEYNKLLKSSPPITDDMIKNFIGEYENPSVEIPNFDGHVNEIETRWRKFVGDLGKLPEPTLEALLSHRVTGSYLTYRDVAAAMRYLNYINSFQSPEVSLEE